MWVEFNTIKDPIIDIEAVREVIITVRTYPINTEIIRNTKIVAINNEKKTSWIESLMNCDSSLKICIFIPFGRPFHRFSINAPKSFEIFITSTVWDLDIY